MSQPRSGCNSWLDDLVRIQEHLTQPRTSHVDDMPERENEACAIHPYPDAGEFFDMDVDVGVAEPGVDVEYFPHAARVYDGGLTFMDQFDTDTFNAQRKANLYYPFASRQDWELGSWLLRSGLSLVAIDIFLSLELVRQSRRYLSNSNRHSGQQSPPFLQNCKGASWTRRIVTIGSTLAVDGNSHFVPHQVAGGLVLARSPGMHRHHPQQSSSSRVSRLRSLQGVFITHYASEVLGVDNW